MNQMERAKQALGKLKAAVGEIDLLARELDDVLGEAQNPPPDGLSDGTISPEMFKVLRHVQKSAHGYVWSFNGPPAEEDERWPG